MSVNEEPGGQGQDVQWRRLDRRLWVGRAGHRSVGTIELGSRYVYVDTEGVPHRGRPTLHEAQDEATGPIDIVRPPATARPAVSRAKAVQVGLVLVAGVLLIGTIWTVGSAIFLQ